MRFFITTPNKHFHAITTMSNGTYVVPDNIPKHRIHQMYMQNFNEHIKDEYSRHVKLLT